jgi:hypothetical protein
MIKCDEEEVSLRMMASRVLLAFENLSLIFGSKTEPLQVVQTPDKRNNLRKAIFV